MPFDAVVVKIARKFVLCVYFQPAIESGVTLPRLGNFLFLGGVCSSVGRSRTPPLPVLLMWYAIMFFPPHASSCLHLSLALPFAQAVLEGVAAGLGVDMEDLDFSGLTFNQGTEFLIIEEEFDGGSVDSSSAGGESGPCFEC